MDCFFSEMSTIVRCRIVCLHFVNIKYLHRSRALHLDRPQTKLWEGNDFTPVCHSVHRGISVQGGLCPGVSVQRGGLCPGGSLSGGLCPGGSLSRGSLSGAVSVWRGLCPGGSLSRGVLCLGISVQRGSLCPGGSLSRWFSVRGGLCLEGSLSRGISVQGGSLSGDLCLEG